MCKERAAAERAGWTTIAYECAALFTHSPRCSLCGRTHVRFFSSASSSPPSLPSLLFLYADDGGAALTAAVAAALTVALAGRGRVRALLRPCSGSRQEQAELDLASLVLFAPRVSVAEAVTQVDASDFAEQHQLQACCRPVCTG